MHCDDGDINVQLLVGEISGPVEVCVNKRWATVCPHGWSDVDAAVACRQLGYDSGKSYGIHYMSKSVIIYPSDYTNGKQLQSSIIFGGGGKWG